MNFRAFHILLVAVFLFLTGAVAKQAFAQKSGSSRLQGEQQEAAEDNTRILERERWFYDQRAFPLGYIPAGARIHALRARHEMQLAEQARRASARDSISAISFPGSWIPIGPQPTSSPYYQPFVSGRVSALAADPRNPNVVYLGAAEGGVWKSTDGGTNWTPLTDAQVSLAVGSIALDPQNPDTVYVGTGEENFAGDNYYGAGVLKSTDGGQTWTQLPGPFVGPTNSVPPTGGAYIGSLAVQPGNSQILLAGLVVFGKPGTSFGQNIMRSTDGGVSWTTTLAGGGGGTVVLFDPTNGSIAYAALGGKGIYRSADGGGSWTQLPGTGSNLFPATSVGRIAIDIASSATATVFASVANSNGALLGVYKTTDSGQNWIQQTNAPDYCTPQCWYDNVIAVDPTNANVVYAGGAFGGGTRILYRSLDGGATWANVTKGPNTINLHPDFHALAFSADGAKLYAGNDGGAWSTTDTAVNPLNWTTLNGTLAITQFYPNMGLHPTNPNIIFGGNQDNGIQRYTGNLTWTDIGYCGDGSSAVIDFNNPSNVYINCNGIDIAKSTTGGSPFSFSVVGGADPFGKLANNGINTADRAGFISPLAMDPSNPSRLYFGTFRLYQTTDGAGTWIAISPDLTNGTSSVSALAVASSSPDTVYVGTANGKVQVTSNALSGGSAVWTDRSSGLPGRYVSSIGIDPNNAATVYVSVSGFNGGHVFSSTNAGANWNDISGNLPNIPVNALVVDPNLPNTLYIGTDVGVFVTTNANVALPAWNTLQTGLPNVVVLSLGLQNSTRLLVAGTHGRSAWKFSLPGSFVLGALSPTSANVPATGTSAPSISFQVSAVGSLSGPVNLTCPSGLPAGANCIFSPSSSVNPSIGSPVTVTLTVTTVGSPIGGGLVTIAANSLGQSQQTQTFTLNVLPDYSFTVADPVQWTIPSQNVTFHGLLATTNGYTSNVTVSCGAGQPPTCAPPGLLVPSLGGTMANVAAGSPAAGDFTFNINTSGADVLNLSRSQPVILHVVQLNFGPLSSNSLSIAQGNSQTVTFQVGVLGSLAGNVNFSCANLPPGASCTFSPTSVQPTPSSPVLVSLVVNSGTASQGGPTTVNVNAAVTNPAFNVDPAETFSLSVTAGAGPPVDLAVALADTTGASNSLEIGKQGVFVATVSNNTSATSVTATLVLVFSHSIIFGTLPAGCNLTSPTQVTCSFTSDNAQPPVVFQIPVIPLWARNLGASAFVSSPAQDPGPNDNTAVDTIQVRPLPLSRKGLPPQTP
jgi:photosystem II stability/assembly factor-like uncharacterized protein